MIWRNSERLPVGPGADALNRGNRRRGRARARAVVVRSPSLHESHIEYRWHRTGCTASFSSGAMSLRPWYGPAIWIVDASPLSETGLRLTVLATIAPFCTGGSCSSLGATDVGVGAFGRGANGRSGFPPCGDSATTARSRRSRCACLRDDSGSPGLRQLNARRKGGTAEASSLCPPSHPRSSNSVPQVTTATSGRMRRCQVPVTPVRRISLA